ncbi:hypothetical protein C0J52_25888 [Blattella germanica]|nr:hypothetical protein C0J52_25888 [Blattella germanica]
MPGTCRQFGKQQTYSSSILRAWDTHLLFIYVRIYSGPSKMALDFAATYKVLVLGDSNVGKTCIVHRYCDERYYDTYISTIGIDFKQKIINLDGVPIKLQIWDTAGQERFRTLTTAYYRGAMGILLMYDVTSLDSFNHLSYWLRNIQEGNEVETTMNAIPLFSSRSGGKNNQFYIIFIAARRKFRHAVLRGASLFDSAEKKEGSEVDLTKSKLQQTTEAWRCAC